ncbi:hypothetical protein S83_006937 [Arachis hypogaea]
MASADREPRPIESHSRLIALFEKEAVSDHGRVIRLRRRGAEILNKGLVTSWGNAFIRIGSGLEPALSRLRIRISNLSIVLVRFRWGATIPLVVQDQVLAHCDGIAGMEGPPTPPGTVTFVTISIPCGGGADDATDLSVLCHANNGAWHPAKPSLSAGHPSHPSFAYSVRPSGWSIVLTAGNQWASSENK